jgi:hypothetical protein
VKQTPLKPISAKRQAKFAEAGIRPYSTLTPASRAREPRMATSKPKRQRDNGPDAATVANVLGRDGGCVRCGGALHGRRGVDYSIHHRKLRSQGLDNSLPALVALCGDGVRGCHGWAHHNRKSARDLGLIIKPTQDPAAVPVEHAQHGRVFLLAGGGWSTRAPEVAA